MKICICYTLVIQFILSIWHKFGSFSQKIKVKKCYSFILPLAISHVISTSYLKSMRKNKLELSWWLLVTRNIEMRNRPVLWMMSEIYYFLQNIWGVLTKIAALFHYHLAKILMLLENYEIWLKRLKLKNTVIILLYLLPFLML